MQVLSDVRAIIAEQLGTELDKVEAGSKFVDLGADSLDTVEIMMALEEKFDLQAGTFDLCSQAYSACLYWAVLLLLQRTINLARVV